MDDTSNSRAGAPDPIEEFSLAVARALTRLRAAADCLQMAPDTGSVSLRCAIAAGLPAQVAYTVKDTARYSGVNAKTLYKEHDAGRLRFKKVPGSASLISVKELDRWMEENDGA